MTHEDLHFEINRHIGNRTLEEHPWRSNGAGMVAFLELLELLPQCNDAEFARYMAEIEAQYNPSRRCQHCQGKLAAWMGLFWLPRDPSRARHFRLEALKISAREEESSWRPDVNWDYELPEEGTSKFTWRACVRERLARKHRVRDYEAEVLTGFSEVAARACLGPELLAALRAPDEADAVIVSGGKEDLLRQILACCQPTEVLVYEYRPRTKTPVLASIQGTQKLHGHGLYSLLLLTT